MSEEVKEKVVMKQEEEEKKPEDKKEEEEDKVEKLLLKVRDMLAEFNKAVNEFIQIIEGVEKKLEGVEDLNKKMEEVHKKLEEIEKKIVTVEEVSSKREKERVVSAKQPAIPTKDGEVVDIDTAYLQRVSKPEYMNKGVEVAETPRPDVTEEVKKTSELDEIMEKIAKGEATIEDLAKIEKMLWAKKV